MKNIFIFILFIVLISGCSIKKIEPKKQEENLTIVEVYHPPLPERVILKSVKWKVFTPAIMNNYINSINAGETSQKVWFSITPTTYESLSYNVAEIKRHIEQLHAIIGYYRETVKYQSVVDRKD